MYKKKVGIALRLGGVPDRPMFTFPLKPSFHVVVQNLYLQDELVPPPDLKAIPSFFLFFETSIAVDDPFSRKMMK